jgi:hypothetical protein
MLGEDVAGVAPIAADPAGFVAAEPSPMRTGEVEDIEPGEVAAVSAVGEEAPGGGTVRSLWQ